MILMNDFKAEPAELRERMVTAVRRVFDSGWYILGKELSNFEAEWARQCGTAHALGVGNGMDAIEIALRGLGIGPGDEVITTSMTAFASVLAIVRAGATPVLADIDAETALLSAASVERCITPRTKALLLVHLYGQVRDMDAWVALCSQRNIHLVEDCAQAHLASWGGRSAGGFGSAAAFSFYPTKNLGAIGDGGMLVTNDQALAVRAAQLRNYGQSVRYHHPVIGLNSRLDEIQAAILGERLAYLPAFTARRREIAVQYRASIRNPLLTQLAPAQEDAAHVHHLYVLQCTQRDDLIAHLARSGVQSLVHYPVPVHAQESCPDIARDPAGLPNTEHHAATCLSIPCHPQMAEADVEAVANALNAFSPS
ncbi:MAG: DegT/DnrJ/EryC1/StrS family aminotransferase [Pseudomonadota bacterium]